jgi:hypothetical protein
VAEQLGQAVLTLKVNDDDLIAKLNAARRLLGSLDTRPIKLKVDASGTASALATTEKGLRNISTEADKAAIKTRTLNQVISSFPSGTYSGISAQIRKLTQESGKLQLTSGQYLKTLTRIKELEGLRSIRAGRQGVIADANAVAPGGALSKLDPAQLPQLPKTIAGDLQLVKELTQRLRNLDQGTTAYELTLRRLDATQQRVNDSAARVLSSRETPTPGFKEFSASVSQRDPVKSSIAREAQREGKERENNLRITKAQLDADLQRAVALRGIANRIKTSASDTAGGFGEASASNFGTSDPVQKSIRRNKEKTAEAKSKTAEATSRKEAQLDTLLDDLARVTARRVETAKQTLAVEKRRKERSKGIGNRVSGALGSGLIGGGFPLLFGQGAGAAVGGAVGGVGGGAIGGQFGFALSVIGTAVGAAFDAALEKGKTLAAGLEDPIGQFDKLREAALFSSKGIEKTVGALIAAGRGEEAKIIAQGDLNTTFGGAENAKAFADATDELNRAWTEATVVLAGFVSGPLADFIQRLNNEIKISPDGVLEAQKESKNFVDPQFSQLEKSFGINKTVDFNGKQFTGDAASVYQQITDEIITQKRATVDAANAEAQRVLNAERLADAAKRNLELNKNNLALIKAQASGNRTEVLDIRERQVKAGRTKALNELPDGDTNVQRETINVEADKELVKIGAERLKLQRELTKALLDEAAARAAIVRQIQTAEAGREAALARADFGASPGSSALGARAGAAEGAAFKRQNQEGLQAAIAAQRQLQSNLQFEVDPGKQAELVERIKTAAEQTRLAYVQAGTALAEKAGQAAASLQGARDSLRSTLEGNSKLIPRADRAILKDAAKADIDRGRRTGILREGLRTPGSTKRQFEIAAFVRQVEQQRAQIASQQALVEALNNNTNAERRIEITFTPDGQGGYNGTQSDSQAAFL